MSGIKYDNIQNRLPLTGIVFFLAYFLSMLTDRNYAALLLGGRLSLASYVADIAGTLLTSFVFVELSIFYSRWLFRYISFTGKPYCGLFVKALLLLLMNNLMAWFFSTLGIILCEESHSFFYTGAHYMESVIQAEQQRKELEIRLLKEKEHAAQMQLEVLKSQIDPHFMFNNFSILSELIMENPMAADKFLEHLSNVYRYVVQNLKRNTVSIQEEITFLRSYIYLIKMRYEDAVCIALDETLSRSEGLIPPVCLQLLVENAIKHNRLSAVQPLKIYIYREKNYIAVENDLRPIASEFASTGIGLQNIVGRYFLLCEEKPLIEKQENIYCVKLPIIHETP